MKRIDAIALNQSLMDRGLKVKDMSVDDFLEIHSIKMKLKSYINGMSEKEKELFEAYSLTFDAKLPDKKTDPGFWEKLEVIQSDEVTLNKLNFINKDDFKKLINEIDLLTASVLAEFLLKTE